MSGQAFFQGTEMPDAEWWTALWPEPAGVLAAVGLTPGMKAIDLCCGDGWFTMPMVAIASRVVAVDIDKTLLEVGRRRLADKSAANCDFIAGDAAELARLVPWPADFVFLANAFHGAPDQSRLARTVHDILKPGGYFAVVNWHPRPRDQTTVLGQPRGPKTELRMSPHETIKAIEPGGLRHARTVEVPPYHYGAVFVRPAG